MMNMELFQALSIVITFGVIGLALYNGIRLLVEWFLK